MDWDYHIKVYPWVTFGHVEMRMKPSWLSVQKIWSATIVSNEVEGTGQDVRAAIACLPCFGPFLQRKQLQHEWEADFFAA